MLPVVSQWVIVICSVMLAIGIVYGSEQGGTTGETGVVQN